MLHKLVGLVLSPLLIAQGKRLRSTIPVLPEPEGERLGSRGKGAPLSVLFAGDSAMAGVGAGSQAATLYAQVVERLASRFEVNYRVEARTGARTKHTLRALARMESSSFDAAVISLGVNDITGGVRTSVWIERQRELMDLLHERFGVRTMVLSGMPPVHGFPALPHPLRWVLGRQAKEYTRALQRMAEEEGHLFVPIDFTSDPSLMASDGFHPGPEIYRMWAERIADRIMESREGT